ncbi:MAG: hypothetical protein IT223_08860, partial [Crocinitomicaceae bacterium]|nr:hypothetical protein [Crocinitomicaceae bacterium]
MKKQFFTFLASGLLVATGLAQVQIDKPLQMAGADGDRNITNLELPVNGTDAV